VLRYYVVALPHRADRLYLLRALRGRRRGQCQWCDGGGGGGGVA